MSMEFSLENIREDSLKICCEPFKNGKNIFRDITAPLLIYVCVYLTFIPRFFFTFRNVLAYAS